MSSGAAAAPLVIEIVLWLACVESPSSWGWFLAGGAEVEPCLQELYVMGRTATDLDLGGDLLYGIGVNIS